MSPIERSPAYFATRLARFGTTTVHAGSSRFSLDRGKARGGQGRPGLNSRLELPAKMFLARGNSPTKEGALDNAQPR